MLLKADQWKDYTCLDAGNGEKTGAVERHRLKKT